MRAAYASVRVMLTGRAGGDRRAGAAAVRHGRGMPIPLSLTMVAAGLLVPAEPATVDPGAAPGAGSEDAPASGGDDDGSGSGPT